MRFFLVLLLSFCFLFAAVNINNASKQELVTLKGIGLVKSKSIIEYRKKHGCFQSIEELVKVKGIGKKTLEKNRDDILVGECKNN